MSNPRTVTITTTTTKTIGQIAYEASGDVPRVGDWTSLSPPEHSRWERIAEAVAKALERPVHVPTPVNVGAPSHPLNIPGSLVFAPRPGDPAIPDTWTRTAPWMTLGTPHSRADVDHLVTATFNDLAARMSSLRTPDTDKDL